MGIVLIVALILIYTLGIKKGKLFPKADVDVATMALNPSSGTYQIGQTFDVNIDITTGGVDADCATAVLDFDTNYLDAVSVTPGTATFSYLWTNSINGGRIVYEACVPLSQPVISFNGSGVLATIKFTAKQSKGNTNVTFNYVEDSRGLNNSQIISHSSDTILAQPSNATYTISDVTPTPTPTPNPTATPTSGGGGGKKTPTPTPTSAPTLTPEPTSEPTSEPTPTDIVVPTTSTPTQIAKASPTPTISPAKSPSPSPSVTKKTSPSPNVSPSPETKLAGFSISSGAALVLYIAIPVFITLLAYFIWQWRKKKKGEFETEEQPQNDDDDDEII